MPKSPANSLPLLGWFDEPIKTSISSVFNGVNKSIEAKDFLHKYRRSQFKSLKQRMNTIKILGMQAPIKLIDIYYPAYVSTTIYRRLYEKDWYKRNELMTIKKIRRKKSPAIKRADEYIEKHNKVMILGGPGTGKTTFLRFLAYAYSDKKTFQTTNLKVSKFPIFISLPDLAKSELNIFEYAANELKARTDEYASAFLERAFKKDLGILLLDSLDEVPKTDKHDIINDIKSFINRFPNCSIVLTCRTADYDEILEDFYDVELVRLSDSAVRKIVKAWFNKDMEKAQKLLKHLKNDEAVSALTETPLLLSLLCIQFRHDLSLPKRKVELYQRCVEALLRDWDATRGFRRETAFQQLTDDRKLRIFEHVAYYFFKDQPRYIFPEQTLVDEIANYGEKFGISRGQAIDVLREIESHHGIFEKISINAFGFSHPSFQEYFTARAILSRRIDYDIVKKFLEAEDWSAVIEFILAIREEPEQLVDIILSKSDLSSIKTYPAMARRTRNLTLLYRCLSTAPLLSKKKYQECYRHILKSQVEISKVYREGGVVPFAVLVNDGVSHSYYYWRKRPTLYDALQPLRKLANTIYHLPSEDYAMIVEAQINDIISRPALELEDYALILCLIIPLSSHFPKTVKDILVILNKMVAGQYGDFLTKQISSTISAIK